MRSIHLQAMPFDMPHDLDFYRSRLRDLKAELQAISENTAQDRSAVQLDQQSIGRLSRMDSLQRQAMAMAHEAARKRNIGRIEAALRRIDSGEFGFCEECGADLPDKRLDFDPMAERCVSCAQ